MWNRREILTIFVVMAIAVLLYIPRTTPSMIAGNNCGDTQAHVLFAKKMIEQHRLVVPHFLYHLFVIAVHAILPWFSWWFAGSVVSMSVVAGSAALNYCIVRPCLSFVNQSRANLWAGFMALCLLIVAPINLLTLPFGNAYFGYVGINVYHNPTVNLVKPLALILIMLVAGNMFSNRKARRPKTIVGAALITLLSMLAKPNFAMCFIPALVVWLLYLRLNKNTSSQVDFKLPLFGAIVPGLFMLALQYGFYRESDVSNASSIVFAPLEVYASYGHAKLLLPKLLLSLVFPLSVLLYFRKKVLSDPMVVISWITLFFGLMYSYLLAEHPCFQAGNMLWSAQVSLYALFVFTTLFLLKTYSASDNDTLDILKKRKICWSLFGLHAISGVGFWFIWSILGHL